MTETLRHQMDAALGRVVVPRLREHAFTGSLPHFRRRTAGGIDLLSFQFDKWGGGFVIEISRCPADGFVTHWGKEIPPNKVTAQDPHPDQRHRLKANEGSATDSWFRYEGGDTEQVAQDVLEKLSDAEVWWATRIEAEESASRTTQRP
jgi:hypothetical protein